MEALVIAYGEGRNGKSTFWNVIARVLGTYSGNISADMLTVGCRRNVKPELAEAKGKRMLIAAELEEGMRLNTAEYVEAARAGGASPARIILSHIIPNTLGIILVNVTLNVSSLVIYQSTLSFIGLSLPAPAPEWGSMLSSARVDMLRAPTLVLFPALAIVLTAFSVNLLGDGLRDAMDPRLKS